MAEAAPADNIVVTGFGPFGVHKINASWEAVKLLPSTIDGYNVVVQEIPVSYDVVDRKIANLWRQHTPKLVVHVGVSNQTQVLQLETCAHKDGYKSKDCYGFLPTTGDICPTECKEMEILAGMNIDEICHHVNSNNNIAKVVKSTEAGRYLCEYTFYTSLSIDRHRTLFIHVPCLETPYTAEELANAIVEIIKCALSQIVTY